MDIVYAAEKPTIAELLSEHTQKQVPAELIEVTENPDETGSFCIGFLKDHYVMLPDGTIKTDPIGRLRQIWR